MLLSDAAATAVSIWTHGPEPCGLIGLPFPLTLPGDPSSGAPDAAPPPSPSLTGLVVGQSPLFCLGRHEGTQEFLGRGALASAVSHKGCPGGTWNLNTCLVQPPAVTSNGNQVSSRAPQPTVHRCARGCRPAPVNRTHLPLDTGGLIRVSRLARAQGFTNLQKHGGLAPFGASTLAIADRSNSDCYRPMALPRCTLRRRPRTRRTRPRETKREAGVVA